MNEFACTLITLILLLAFALRVQYLNVLCADWNYKLELYIIHLKEKNYHNVKYSYELRKNNNELISFSERKIVTPMSHWLSLKEWSIKSIVKDDDFIKTVNNHIMMLSE